MYGRLSDPSLLFPLLEACVRHITCFGKPYRDCLGIVLGVFGCWNCLGIVGDCFGTVRGLFGGCAALVRSVVRSYVGSFQPASNLQTVP